MPGEPLDAPGGGVGFCPRGVPAAQGAPRILARKMPAAPDEGRAGGRDSVTGLKSAVRARRAENADERPRGMKVTRGTQARARDVGDEG